MLAMEALGELIQNASLLGQNIEAVTESWRNPKLSMIVRGENYAAPLTEGGTGSSQIYENIENFPHQN